MPFMSEWFDLKISFFISIKNFSLLVVAAFKKLDVEKNVTNISSNIFYSRINNFLLFFSQIQKYSQSTADWKFISPLTHINTNT